MSLDPSTFVDTSNWAGEMGLGSGRPGAAKPPAPGRPPATTKGRATPAPGDIDSLEQMLEPDRTGLHGKAERKLPWALIILLLAVLAAGAAAAVVLAMR